ncbi:MAG: hypothetical protein N3G20_04910 [Verrucomicrobiae bacterium]|nr:hypothetical protein [Verrucomicrobiae bacterium]
MSSFCPTNLIDRQQKVPINQQKEHLVNTSVCRDDRGRFVVAYESDDTNLVRFTVKLAVSAKLLDWVSMEAPYLAATATTRVHACALVTVGTTYFTWLYLEHCVPRWFFEICLATSRDLRSWEFRPADHVNSPSQTDGTSASNPDIMEFQARLTTIALDRQLASFESRHGMSPGSIARFFRVF